jgi:hypothetical protein
MGLVVDPDLAAVTSVIVDLAEVGPLLDQARGAAWGATDDPADLRPGGACGARVEGPPNHHHHLGLVGAELAIAAVLLALADVAGRDDRERPWPSSTAWRLDERNCSWQRSRSSSAMLSQTLRTSFGLDALS